MASESSILRNIDENFCQCSICLEQFKKPKLLPCLHRFCSKCLRQLLQETRGVLKCPECREECEIPAEGVDGLKTDFYMNSIVDFIQLQKSVKENQVMECLGCSNKRPASAYCFKCEDFLCAECHNYHMKNKMMKDHRTHVLSLQDIEGKNITLEKLVSLKEVPRCQTHPENSLQLSCYTCNKVPICVSCTYGKHKDHVIFDVSSLANNEREMLQKKLQLLYKNKAEIYEMPVYLNTIQQEVILKSTEKTETILKTYNDEITKITETQQTTSKAYQLTRSEMEKNLGEKLDSLNRMMEEEIKEVRHRYNKEVQVERDKSNAQLESSRKSFENDKLNLDTKKRRIEKQFHELSAFIENEKKENLEKIQNISEHVGNMQKNYENLITTATTILSSSSDWAAMTCIPDISSAADRLLRNVTEKSQPVGTLTMLMEQKLSSIRISNDKVKLSERWDSVIDLKEVQSNRYKISGTAYADNGTIVVCVWRRSISYLLILNWDGKTVTKELLPQEFSLCSSLSNSMIAVLSGNSILLFGITEGTNHTTSIPVLMTTANGRCIATDKLRNRTFVGTRQGDIFEHDDQFRLIRTLKSKEDVKNVIDIAATEGCLLLCDYGYRKAIAVNQSGKLVYSFSNPKDEGVNWRPCDVCTDKEGFIYMMWTADDSPDSDCILVQYSKHGGDILTSIQVDSDSQCITTAEKDGREKMLITTNRSGKLYIYDLA